MSILSFLFGSSPKAPASPPRIEPPRDPQPLRLAIGPSPWAFRDRQTSIRGVDYHFRETAPGDGKLAGMTSLQDSTGATLLVFDSQCHARILDAGEVLLWRESTEQAERRIIFDCVDLSSLRPVSDPRAAAVDVRERKIGYGPLPSSQHWEFSSQLEAGVHSFSMRYDWSHFEETLVLASHGDANKMTRAIFAFNWGKRQVSIFPQDWFNSGNYDFEYQWIARVVRRTDDSIVGEGARLGQFELDDTNRQVKQWLAKDAAYEIK